MSIKKTQAILKCFIHLKSSAWFTLGSENETMLCDTLLKISDCWSFSVLKTLTGSRPEKDSKCHKAWFSVNQALDLRCIKHFRIA